MQKSKSIVLSGAVLCLISGAANAAVIYDAGGFEPAAGFTTTGGFAANPAQTPGSPSIYGQGGTDYWTYATSGASTASVAAIETTTKFAGAQALQFTRVATDPDSYYYPHSPIAGGVPASSTPVINISWEMNLATGTNNPFIGISVFNGSDALGYAGVNATTGVVEYSGVANTLITSGASIVPNTWNLFNLSLNYTTQQETLTVNGSFVGQSPFASGVTENGLSDADIGSFNPSGNGTLTAYFDNYSISAVPEPTSGSIFLAGASVAALRRRRRAKLCV